MYRKDIKKKAHQNVKSHWLFLTLTADIALIASVMVPFYMDESLTAVDIHQRNISIDILVAPIVQHPVLFALKLITAIFIGILFLQMQTIVANRLFLEARTYPKVPVQHAFYIISVKKWFHTAFAYFRKLLYLFLWSLTIIGGCVKYYSYFLVSFILAENPSLSGKEAINLSRKMMNGHKWEAFKLQITMLPWFLLSAVTFGIAGYLYVNPYINAVYSEYYAVLRSQAKASAIEGAEQLNDTYLFTKAEDETLQKAYKDIRLDRTYVRMNAVELKGIQKFLTKVFGLFIGSERSRRLYQGTGDIRLQIEMNENVIAKDQYPFRLSPLYVRRNAHFEGQLNYRRTYSPAVLLILAVLFGFAGWLLEFAGFFNLPQMTEALPLKGPWLFSSAATGLLCLMLSASVRNKPAGTFLLSAVISGIILYFTSVQTAVAVNANNICLFVCLILLAGLFSVFVIYIVAPYIDNQLSAPESNHLWIAFVLIADVLFILDIIRACLDL